MPNITLDDVTHRLLHDVAHIDAPDERRFTALLDRWHAEHGCSYVRADSDRPAGRPDPDAGAAGRLHRDRPYDWARDDEAHAPTVRHAADCSCTFCQHRDTVRRHFLGTTNC
jgi:hypothetical protein